MALALVRGVFWSAATPVWSPIDEMAHFGYAQSLGDGRGIPVIGTDLISTDVIIAAKHSPIADFRGEPYQPTPEDALWGPARHQYEATAGPIPYVYLATAYVVAAPAGLTGQILAMRIAAAALVLAVIALTWTLARRLFPASPPVWLVAAALVTVVNSFAFGAVTNDSAAVALALASLLTLLRALDDRGSLRGVAIAGLVLGAAILTKGTVLVVAPVMLVVVVTWIRDVRPSAGRIARMLVTYSALAAIVLAPWLIWNLATYGATSGVAEVIRVLPPSTTTFTIDRLGTDVAGSQWGMWANQLLSGGATAALWLGSIVATSLAALVVATRRGQRDVAFGVAVCLGSLPTAIIVLEVVNYTLMRGGGAPIGRHLLPVAPILLVGLAGSLATVVGPRWLVAVAGSILCTALVLEMVATVDLFARSYERAVIDEAFVPVDDQGWSDAIELVATVTVDPPCPVAAMSLGLPPGSQPSLVVVAADGTRTPVAPVATTSGIPIYAAPDLDSVWYRFPVELAERFTIELPPETLLNVARDDRSPAMSAGGSDPVGRIYCRGSDARDVAFTRDYGPGHLGGIPRAAFLIAQAAVIAIGVALTAAAWWAAVRRPRPILTEETAAT